MKQSTLKWYWIQNLAGRRQDQAISEFALYVATLPSRTLGSLGQETSEIQVVTMIGYVPHSQACKFAASRFWGLFGTTYPRVACSFATTKSIKSPATKWPAHTERPYSCWLGFIWRMALETPGWGKAWSLRGFGKDVPRLGFWHQPINAEEASVCTLTSTTPRTQRSRTQQLCGDKESDNVCCQY